jgi:hypothetical protein
MAAPLFRYTFGNTHGALLTLVALLGAAANVQAQNYQNAEDAYKAGVGFLLANDLANSQTALEEALQLAKDVKFKVQVHRALGSVYRTLPEIDKMATAAEFIITHSDSPAERSLRRSDLLSFVHQRGKVKALGLRCEDRLNQVPDDKTSLYILAELYDRWLPNPQRGTEINERLLALLKKEGGSLDIRTASQLAQQHTRNGKYQEGAELFEKLAPLDAKLGTWHWKEAAQAWLKAKDKDKALTAAKASAASRPEKRSESLTFFWHKGLADVFLKTDEPKLAIEHFEKALEHTDIAGYRRDCQGGLALAREKAAKQEKK